MAFISEAHGYGDRSGGGEKPIRTRGSNQVGMRQYNERVVLQAIRLHGATSKAELARLTHLSTQTVALIVDRLLRDELVVKGDPRRGKVGQPSVPLTLNPDGAFSVGIHVGRRCLDVLVLDFVGNVRERSSMTYRFPDPEVVFAEVAARIRAIPETLGPALARRVHGVGVAAPLALDRWQALLGVERERAARWAGVDIGARIAELTELPVEFSKDTAAACVAELVAGRGRSIRSFLYTFVDAFVGGGLVLDSHLRAGLRGNAGAIGSLPLERSLAAGAKPGQLLSAASVFNLERLYAAAGLDPGAAVDGRALERPWLAHTSRWLTEASRALALAAVDAACLLDLEGVIVDGAIGRSLLARLVAEVDLVLEAYDWEGVSRPAVLEGKTGSDARAVGAGLLPLYANFAPAHDLFLKVEPPEVDAA
jgi:predicted NBD/HSP70 family sugar kinase